jgi:hypothetical protein
MSKFLHLPMPRAFRDEVKSELTAIPGWEQYRKAQAKKPAFWGRDEIFAACEALGLDLADRHALWIARGGASGDEDEAAPETAPEAPSASTPSEGFEGRDATALIAEALAPAGVHMTPWLQAELPKLLAPMAQAAVATPRERIVERVVIKSAPSAGASIPPVVNVTHWKPAREIFGMRRNAGGAALKHALENALLPVCDFAGAPSLDPDYVWQNDIVAQFAAMDSEGLNVWTFGAAGTGKTEAAMQYAARMRRPFFRIAMDRTTEPVDLIGQMVLAKGGGMEWQDGKLTRAFRTPYAVILIDEPTLLRSGTLAVFQTALDTRKLWLGTGEVVEAAQGIFVIAADNTAGVGDDSGRYVDTSAVNVAFLDRFALRIAFDYLDADSETKMLAHRARLSEKAARIMVEYASATRKEASAGTLTIGVTPRRLIAWAKAVRAGVGSQVAFLSSVIQGSAPEDREALIMLETTSLKSRHGEIDAIARGLAVTPAAPSAEGEGEPSATGIKFPEGE